MQCCAVLSRLFQDFSILTRIVRIKQCRCTYSVPNFVAGWDVEYELFDPQDPIPRRAETGVHQKSKKYFSSVECVRVVQFCYILLRFSYLVYTVRTDSCVPHADRYTNTGLWDFWRFRNSFQEESQYFGSSGTQKHAWCLTPTATQQKMMSFVVSVTWYFSFFRQMLQGDATLCSSLSEW